MTKHLYFLGLLLLISHTSISSAKSLHIVASIKPVYSLVAEITHGVSKPVLLINTKQSPHHYKLRPSERKLLATADLIFWIGPNLESFMPRLLNSLENKNKAISLIHSKGLQLLPLRTTENSHNHEQHSPSVKRLSTSKIDSHFWLNTQNVDRLIDAISQKIIQLDPEHKQQYQANSQRLHKQVSQLRKTLQASMSTVKKSFLTYHDGYQYFEEEFDLLNRGFVSSSELQPSAKHINELKKIIQQQNIECIFYDAPTQPAMLKLLLRQDKTRAYMLDPVGSLLPLNKNNWFEIMHALAKQFKNCQQGL